jgi:hypothetical protein
VEKRIHNGKGFSTDNFLSAKNPYLFNGAGGRNRTDTPLQARDFESRASTNFTTPANCPRIIAKALYHVKKEKP